MWLLHMLNQAATYQALLEQHYLYSGWLYCHLGWQLPSSLPDRPPRRYSGPAPSKATYAKVTWASVIPYSVCMGR